MKKIFRIIGIVVLAGFINVQAYAHCEVPCGIYTDHLRIELIKEHLQTIEKAMTQIEKLSSEETVNYNQLVRWIDTKEHHANLIQEIVEQYFMTQRIKPVDPEDVEAYNKYISQITVLHKMLILSMKAKQGTDIEVVHKLHKSTEKFTMVYFSPEDLEHMQGHDH